MRASAPLRVRVPGAPLGHTVPALGLMLVAVVVGLGSALAQRGGHHGTDGALLALTVRVVAITAAAGVVGCLLICLCLPRAARGLDLDLLGPAAGWALVWVAALLAGFALELANPLSIAQGTEGHHVSDDAARLRWLVLGVVLAASVRVLCAAVRTRADVRVVLAVALAGIVVATGAGHDGPVLSPAPASVALLAHVLAATAWIGGLLALVLHGRTIGPGLAVAPTVRAYSRLALGCYLVLFTSGVLGLLSHTGVAGLLDSGGYLWVVAAKLALLLLLGIAGTLQRRTGLVRLEAGERHRFLLLAVGELVMMAAALGLGVTLAHSSA